MFKKVFILFIFSLFSIEAQVEDVINSFINKNQQSLSNEDISNGLKQALEISTIKSCENASSIDGFLKNELIKIKFPKEGKKIKKSLKKIGMEKQVNSFVISMNRAAEEASKEAVDILRELSTNYRDLYENISELTLNKDDEYVLILADRPTRVILGKENINLKFNILKSFDKALGQRQLTDFSLIDMRYNKQLVAREWA